LKKKCIFHIPYGIEKKNNSGSVVRPNKMIDAFKKIGYEVEVIEGFGVDRRDKIKKVITKINSGILYDFVYTECSNLPTYYSDLANGHLGIVLDFKFLRICKKNGIHIGFFYRDVHWKFPHFKINRNKFKLFIGELLYKIELLKYRNLLDVLYIPSYKMLDYIPVDFSTKKVEELPPGSNPKDDKDCINSVFLNGDRLKIFYVGGLSDLYKINLLVEVVSESEFLELTICCRKKEWEKTKKEYEKYLCNRIDIIHLSGEELESYFKNADILSIFVQPLTYWNIAVPIKLFEYIGNIKPIISVSETAVGNFVKENNLGWTADYKKNDLKLLLKDIYLKYKNTPNEIVNIKKNIYAINGTNTWEHRVKKVVNDLERLKK
jgi:hypothetical protein